MAGCESLHSGCEFFGAVLRRFFFGCYVQCLSCNHHLLLLTSTWKEHQIIQKHNDSESQKLSLTTDSRKTAVESEECVTLLNGKVLPEPDPELKSSSSSGYPPDPVSSRYRSSVEDGDFTAVTNIYTEEHSAYKDQEFIEYLCRNATPCLTAWGLKLLERSLNRCLRISNGLVVSLARIVWADAMWNLDVVSERDQRIWLKQCDNYKTYSADPVVLARLIGMHPWTSTWIVAIASFTPALYLE